MLWQNSFKENYHIALSKSYNIRMPHICLMKNENWFNTVLFPSRIQVHIKHYSDMNNDLF